MISFSIFKFLYSGLNLSHVRPTFVFSNFIRHDDCSFLRFSSMEYLDVLTLAMMSIL